MKTIFDLPDQLLQRIKFRAVQERRAIKYLVANLLNQSLNAAPISTPTVTNLHAANYFEFKWLPSHLLWT